MLALSLALAVGPAYISVSKPSVSVRHSPVVVRHHTLVPTTSVLRPFVARVLMKDDNRTPDPKKDDPKRIDATSVISGLTTLAIAGAFALDVFGGGLARAPEPPVIAYSQLVKEIKAGEVAEVLFSPTDRELFVLTSAQTPQRVSIFPSAQPELVSLLEAKDIPFSVAQSPAVNPLLQFGELLLRLAFPAFLLFSIFGNRGGGGGGTVGGGGGGGPMGMIQNLGKAKSKVQLEPDTGVNFADVAGCDGSKLELREVVEFLKTPGKFAAVGARAPRGVLLEGPPGTGKTLLARAVAGEAGVPFISASGSEFVEMFVGVGASRIRDLFAQAKAASPCIIFIDEIDAIGKSRAGGGGGMGGGNDEREQTLNQILTEMDGFEKATGVVVIAATNRADVLDSALLRPGRFDRRVPVELPDRIGRRAILSVHARDKPLGSDVDLDAVAARTTGFSGASLANLLNEAAIVTARRDKKELGMPEVEYALDRLTVGLEKSTGMASEARKRLVAVHEAGHAILAALTPGFDAVGKVTIVPRSNGAGGFTLFVPSDERQDSGMYSRRYLESQLEVALGGRVAEEIIYGADDVTTGASSDLQRVADVARRMVTQWGFATDSLSATAWESPMGTNFNSQKMASEATQQRIDAAVETIVRSAYEKCKATLTKNRALLDELADLLVEQETIGNDELMVLVKKHAVQPGSAGAGELL